MATTADFRNGLCIEFNNDLYTIVEFQHVKPGKGGAFVRSKLKSLTKGKVIENTFTAGEKIETARIEKRPFQFLYKDETGYNFMDNNTFEQVTLEENIVEVKEYEIQHGIKKLSSEFINTIKKNIKFFKDKENIKIASKLEQFYSAYL